MQTIYLDQNKWIQLARVANEIEQSPNLPRLRDALDFVRGASAAGLACFPLSLAHYLETHKQADPARRQRLADFMLEISGGVTIASPEAILRHEIDAALADRFPGRVRVEPLHLLGRRVFFASDKPERRITIGRDVAIDPALRRRLERAANRMLDLGLLSGVDQLSGVGAPRTDLRRFDANFQQHLDVLHARLDGLDRETQERALYAISLNDILDPFNEALVRHGITWDDIAMLGGPEQWMALIEDMPTRKVDVHLHRQFFRNKQLQAKSGDLNDWGYVAELAMYTDVVVTERSLASMLKRDGFQTRAQTITDLGDLPRIAARAAI